MRLGVWMIFESPPRVIWRGPPGLQPVISGSSLPNSSRRARDSASAQGWMSDFARSAVMLAA